MPYEKLSEVNPALRGIEPPITLAQANLIVSWADEIERSGADVESPWGVAIAQFKKAYHIEDGKWMKNKPKTKELSFDERIRHIRDAWQAKFASSGVPAPEEVYEDRITVSTPKGLMAYPYTIQDDGMVEFGDPVQVKAREDGDMGVSPEAAQNALVRFFDGLSDFVAEAVQKLKARADVAGEGAREAARKAQEKRSQKWGITILETGSNLTISAEHKAKGATFSDFADPVNIKYPCWLTKSRDSLDAEQLGQVRNAPARFAQFKDNYDTKSRGVVAGRIEKALKKFEIGEYATKGAFYPVVKGVDGKDWWLAFSATAFLDREEEIISRKAMDYGVADADRTGERGDLRLFHLPGSRVGSKEVQLREGCFLIEAGRWDETDVAVAAKSSLKESPEKWKTSIGFEYNADYFVGGIYTDQVRFLETSIVSANRAANPFTAIIVSQEVKMSSKEDLLELLGDETLVDKVLTLAAQKTDELSRLVSFKQQKEDDSGKATGLMAQINEIDNETLKEIQEAISAKLLGGGQGKDIGEGEESKGEESPSLVEIDDGVIKAIAAEVVKAVDFEARLAAFGERLETLGQTVAAQGESVTVVKSLLDTDIDEEVQKRVEALPAARFVLAEKSSLFRQSQEPPEGAAPETPVVFKSPLGNFGSIYDAMRSSK